MNKQEIIDEISKTKEYLANLEKMLKECESKRWKPEPNEEYYYVNQVSATSRAVNDEFDIDAARCRTYNCFKTEEEAKQEAEKILVRRQLEDIARRLNKGQEINWSDDNQIKYCIRFDFPLDMISICARLHQKLQGSVYCLSDKFKDVAIQEIGEERLKKYLRGE